MERLTKKKYPKMEIGFCTEIDCLARDFCPGLKKHNRLFDYEETGITPEQIQTVKLVLQQRYSETEGTERAIYKEVLEMLGEPGTALIKSAAKLLQRYCDVHCFYENDGVCDGCAFMEGNECCPLETGSLPADWRV